MKDDIEIRGLLGRVPGREIAAEFGVARSTICHISTGKSWGHL